MDPLKEKLSTMVKDHRPYSMLLKSGGVFPDQRRPRVFWTGIFGDGGKTERLAKEVGRILVPLGFEKEARPFKGHLTLGRSRQPTVGLARQFCTLVSTFQSPMFEVKDIHLVQSHLQSQGARYETLESFSLNASPDH